MLKTNRVNELLLTIDTDVPGYRNLGPGELNAGGLHFHSTDYGKLALDFIK